MREINEATKESREVPKVSGEVFASRVKLPEKSVE